MTINCRTTVECYPVTRSKLYEDFIDKKYGNLHQRWITPGHIFIAVKEGRQLVTFDNKSTNRATDSNFDGCLDIRELKTPIVDILVSATNYSLVYIIEESGNVHCWKYKAETWTFLLTIDICNVDQSTIISVCLHPSQHALFWCERRPSGTDGKQTYCICKRQLPEDEEKLRNKEIGPLVAVMHNCPPCQVYPATSGLYLTVRNKPPLVTIVMLWMTYSNRIIASVGKNRTDISTFSLNQAIEFNKIAVKLAGHISQVKPTENIAGIIYNVQDLILSAVLYDGSINAVLENEEGQSMQPKIDCSEVPDQWFQCQGVIGTFQDSQIMLYIKEDGKKGYKQLSVKTPDGSAVLGFCKLTHGTLWPVFYTENNMYTLQWTFKDDKQTIDDMIKTSNFQTSAVHLSLLEKRKIDSPSPEVYRDLTKLRQEYAMNENQDPNTKLSALLEPYLKNYWELDSIQQTFQTQTDKLPQLTCRTVEEEVMHTISPNTLMSMSARQSWLLILSSIFPHQVLKVLTSLMDFETDDISTSQIQRWQCILANENTTTAVSSDVAVPLFEHICRLMLLIQPQKLVHFVKLCQMINNQKVGVSAFIRKRQALQYYDRALECLPSSKGSEDPDSALKAYVELLMASEKPHCESTALRMYIDQGQWKDGIELMLKYKDNQTLYSNLYLALFRAMSKREVLPEFAEQMFKSSPEISCFSQMSSFLTHKKGTSANDVFATSSCDIPIHKIRSSLLKYYKPKPS